MDSFAINYFLIPEKGNEVNFNLRFNEPDCLFITSSQEPLADWTKLEFHRCTNCPLDIDSCERCPVAVNLSDIINYCGALCSHDRVQVEVTMPDRKMTADMTLQKVLSSLVGLVMATSACPHLAFFRPMARFHLPLANEQETIYRAVSTYLLSQYFQVREGKPADMDLSGLVDIYHQLQNINTAMAARVRAASKQDAASNAVVLLDLFAKTVPYSIEDSLEDIRHLFSTDVPGH